MAKLKDDNQGLQDSSATALKELPNPNQPWLDALTENCKLEE